jgi:hypothetical protein
LILAAFILCNNKLPHLIFGKSGGHTAYLPNAPQNTNIDPLVLAMASTCGARPRRKVDTAKIHGFGHRHNRRQRR